MKITILLKSGPRSDEAERALLTATELLGQGHEVSLFLLQDAVRFCGPGPKSSNTRHLEQLIERGLKVYALTHDVKVRGIDYPFDQGQISHGSYESLIDLMDASDRVVGIL